MTERVSIWLMPRNCSRRSSVCTQRRSSTAQALAWPQSSESSIATVDESGQKGHPTRGRPSTSPSKRSKGIGMYNKAILLVEDNPDDEVLALRALKKNHILNDVV